MKRIFISLIIAAFVLTTTTANAQLFRRCNGGSCAYRAGYVYAPTTGYWTGQCYGSCNSYSYAESYASQPCLPCAPTSDAPRQAAEVFDRYYPEACESVQETIQPCEPVETTTPKPCESCGEYEPIKKSGALVYRSCPTGACPLQTVATLLDRANALRAQNGLSALSYDATLTAGSQYQASFCASRGALIHGQGVAEILAQNSQGLETALNQWLNSPAHRALLLSPNFRFGGVAVHRDSTGRVWCAMRFR